jgi:hypothetical protein
MAFLYSTYIILYAITSPTLGKYIDKISAENSGDIHLAMRNIAGVQFTIVAVIIFAATFVPRGSLSFNPRLLFDENLTDDLGVSERNSGASYETENSLHKPKQTQQTGYDSADSLPQFPDVGNKTWGDIDNAETIGRAI